MNLLSSREDVIKNIYYYEEMKDDQPELLDERKLNIEEKKDKKYGWTWDLSCRITNDYTSCYGNIKKFINAPIELISLIDEVKYFLTKISFTYNNNTNYPLIFYNRKNFDPSLGNGYFATCETGILNCFVNNEKSNEEEILKHISYIEKLIKKNRSI